MDQKSTYKKQSFLSGVQFLSELVNFVVIAISAYTSGSLIMWQDLINSSGNTMRTGLTTAFSRKMTKDLRYKYNYGIGKAEAMISLSCDLFVMVGLLATLVFSVIELFTPKEVNNALVWAIGIKLVCVLFDIPMVYLQYKIKKENNNKVSNSGFYATLGATIFDFAAFVSVTIVYLTKGFAGAQYLSPIFAIIIALYLIVICLRNIKNSVSELTDKTLPEKEQLKIIKVVTTHINEFEEFHEIKTRYNGTTVCIDISISFSDNTLFGQVKDLRARLQEELSEQIENCVVTITVE